MKWDLSQAMHCLVDVVIYWIARSLGGRRDEWSAREQVESEIEKEILAIN